MKIEINFSHKLKKNSDMMVNDIKIIRGRKKKKEKLNHHHHQMNGVRTYIQINKKRDDESTFSNQIVTGIRLWF